MFDSLESNFDIVREQLTKAQEHVEMVRAEMARLERVGMYAVVPTVTWKDEGGKHKYMQLLFPINSQGGYDSPNGKRKYYIGCKSNKIQGAEVMIERRRRYDALEQTASRLESFISNGLFDLNRLAARCGQWRPAPQGSLGPDPGDLVSGFVPKIKEEQAQNGRNGIR